MLMHFVWNHVSQLSQAIPLSFIFTASLHSPHGYFGGRGPGFTSMSCDRRRQISRPTCQGTREKEFLYMISVWYYDVGVAVQVVG